MFSLVVFFFPLYIHLCPFSPHVSPIFLLPVIVARHHYLVFRPLFLWFAPCSYSTNLDSCLLLLFPFVSDTVFLLYYFKKINIFFLFLCVSLHVRPSASDILRAGLLVLYFILRAEPESRRDLPRFAALTDSGWLHRPLQLRAFLSWPVVQC